MYLIYSMAIGIGISILPLRLNYMDILCLFWEFICENQNKKGLMAAAYIRSRSTASETGGNISYEFSKYGDAIHFNGIYFSRFSKGYSLLFFIGS
jgi:hypothetical protein